MKLSRIQISQGLYHTSSRGQPPSSMSAVLRLSCGWTGPCTRACCACSEEPSTHGTWETWATGEEMKVFLVLVLAMVAAATALAFANATVATSVTAAAVQVADHTSEPAALLVSGSVLLGLAGVVRRFTV